MKSAPGFLVNRALTPYLLEAMIMLDEGIKSETIDAAAIKFGMPMGPIELADQVGLDICLHVAEVLQGALPRPMPDAPQWLRDKVAKGELGRKTGKGFYDWKDGKPVKERDAPPPTDVMTDRLILPMIDVCVACLREGVVADEDIGRRRDDLRHRLRAVPRRPDALCAQRGGDVAADAGAAGAGLRRALPARSGLGPDHMTRGGGPPVRFQDPDQLADAIVSRVGKRIVLALPLGLGKANHIANALYARAAADPSIHLRIFTALTLERPRPRNELERRFTGPLSDRLFGGYPDLAYAAAQRERTAAAEHRGRRILLPGRQPAERRRPRSRTTSRPTTPTRWATCSTAASMSSRSSSPSGRSTATSALSLSCNPDITLDLLAARRDGRCDFVFAGQVNSELPFMLGDADLPADEFEFVLDSPQTDFPLFAPPREPVGIAEYAAGLHVARTVRDGGTLQIGIGSLGDAPGAGADPAPPPQRRLPRPCCRGSIRTAHAAGAAPRGAVRRSVSTA